MVYKDRTDEELVEEVAKGSKEAYAVLYERYKIRIFNFVYHLIGKRHLAEDCAQDIFIQLYHKARLFKSGFKFSSWFYRVARNATFDLIRKHKIRRAASLEAQQGDDQSTMVLKDLVESSDPLPDKLLEMKDLEKKLKEGILKLKDKDREIIILCDLQELPHREVAEILDMRVETVAVKLHRARKQLALVLGLDTT